ANTSIQHAAVGSAMTSTGSPAGFFNGKIDEVRIWNIERTGAEISSNYNSELTSGTGLVARWGFNEGCGLTTGNSVSGSVNGTLSSSTGPVWVISNFNSQPPNQPINPSPANNANSPSTSPNICATVSDPNGGNVRTRFYGRPKPAGGAVPFTIVFFPDTQFYTSEMNGGTIGMFNAQTAWVANNRVSKNIVYVGQLGDCVQNGDAQPVEWTRAVAAMATIENAGLTGLPQGVPFGISVGNHDQSIIGDAASPSFYYNQYFGESHFAGRSYYGGHYGSDPLNNDNHFQLFSASGIDFLVISLEYDTRAGFATGAVLDWAEDLVQTYSSRKVIVMTHNLMNESAAFSTQGQAIFNRLSPYTNVIMLHGGHVSSLTGGEAMRADFVNGRTLYSILTDYQSRINGGNGLLRYYEFDPQLNTVTARTYSPHTLTAETDANSQFTLTMNLNNFSFIGETNVASGSAACVNWPGLAQFTEYEWYAELYDGENTTTGPVWTFTTPANSPLPVNIIAFDTRTENNKRVKITWTTTYERDNSHFEVQRSRDAINFTSIATVAARNNTNSLEHYSLYDEQPLKGISYYRLKQIDIDSRTSYSEIEKVKINGLAGGVDIFPNPASGNVFNINITGTIRGTIDVQIFDMNGRLHLQQKFNSNNNIIVNHKLPSGTYMIKITGEGLEESKKLVIK
ncbi:MAG: T9SS type A sorting domain-containing protein, partial [Chitinophagaceae bacterium]